MIFNSLCVFMRLIRFKILWLSWEVMERLLAYHNYSYALMFFDLIIWIPCDYDMNCSYTYRTYNKLCECMYSCTMEAADVIILSLSVFFLQWFWNLNLWTALSSANKAMWHEEWCAWPNLCQGKGTIMDWIVSFHLGWFKWFKKKNSWKN